MAVQEGKISGSIHYDNIAPCYLGGMQLMTLNPAQPQWKYHLDEHYWVMAYPDIIVCTKTAREVLPEQYDRGTAITFAQQLASFISACHNGRYQSAFSYVNDVIAEPYVPPCSPAIQTVARSYFSKVACSRDLAPAQPFSAFIVHSKNTRGAVIETDYVTKSISYGNCKVIIRAAA